MEGPMLPQAFVSCYATRIRVYQNSLLTPLVPPPTAQNALASRTTKRGTLIHNYSEDVDDDFEDSDGPRRASSLRNRRDPDPQLPSDAPEERFNLVLAAPVVTQAIWRPWIGRPKFGMTDKQVHAQVALPYVPIPIRLEIDIPTYTPQPAMPLPNEALAFGINPSLPAYRTPEPIPAHRLKDAFIWDLHETSVTPEHFALTMANELDLPNRQVVAAQISGQIRQQLEEFAPIALHPLFNRSSAAATSAAAHNMDPTASSTENRRGSTQQQGSRSERTSGAPKAANDRAPVTAIATSVGADQSDVNNPDDAYRCIVVLNVNLQDKLFTDKFEWSLLHESGMAEMFARQTCADMGLFGEWLPSITHAIYEAVLKLKKEVIESGGLFGATGNIGEVDNLAFNGAPTGVRYDPEQLCGEWGPDLEILSKEEIERREGDRERQNRRQRRETARFSSAANMAGTPSAPGYFDQQEPTETPMGRGERSKKKRRFKSLSPAVGGGTPTGAPDLAGFGGGATSGLTEAERLHWRCSHCMISGASAWGVRDGPSGQRTLCANCGLFYEREKRLPPCSKNIQAK